MTAPKIDRTNNPQLPTEANSATEQNLTAKQQTELNDPELQARYLAEFNEQMRRLYCPGCGEG
jgi:hypothetical protein